ncbi:MAG: transcription antitermination factor NusB [Proteobacteria bacterium]|nr:transcription antitermination factor NusB [Pseudomonadota bacterium]
MKTTEFDWDKGDDAFPHENGPLTGDKRTEARVCAVQALYQAQLRKLDARDVAKEFELARLAARKADKKLFALIVGEAAEGAGRYQEMIAGSLTDAWTWDRLDPVLRALLWAGCAELTANTKVSIAVVANEYVNIAKGFLPEDQVGFANRMLDVLGRKIKG